ncbi:SIR2 family protein [Thioclava litoralis]|uniref:SIR2 family protein n=1 Tax=Thioclava litoralis TaxID=3076557 RepID=A0ABZ1E0H1_9RHOB|nr:SIR2 family protein [Thioclava sp. FTW29]
MSSLLIFGNGLGRSISNDFFLLEKGLEAAWNSGLVSEPQKKLISACLQDRDALIDQESSFDTVPEGEDELRKLQQVVSACDMIRQIEDQFPESGDNWLTDNGRAFPTAIRKFVHQTACYFLNRNTRGRGESVSLNLNTSFVSHLNNFLIRNTATVATLNYDDLLYDAFNDTEVFTGRRRLRDGFGAGGSFNFSQAERRQNMFGGGWYLQLHGTPLFINDANGEPRKLTRRDHQNKIAQEDYDGTASIHLVLTNVNYKPAIIQSSEILKTYWEKLRLILPSATNIVLMGYGGRDNHLNDLLASYAPEASIRVVEFSNDSEEEHLARWNGILKGKVSKTYPMSNIQEFHSWAAE